MIALLGSPVLTIVERAQNDRRTSQSTSHGLTVARHVRAVSTRLHSAHVRARQSGSDGTAPSIFQKLLVLGVKTGIPVPMGSSHPIMAGQPRLHCSQLNRETRAKSTTLYSIVRHSQRCPRTCERQQLVITSLFLGLGFAQMIYGPLSDSIGRKRAIYIGYVIFMIGCLFSIFPRNFEMMLLGRVLQGGGAASARTVCIALVRDQYEGREMARIMSFVMGVFILVPIVAPAMGQGILVIFHWRAIFVMFLLLAIIACLWFAIRQPESLPRQHRVRFSASVIWSGVRQTCRNRIAFGYTLIMGLIFGAFVGYLSSVQQVFSDIYSVIDQFPLYFATLALSIGLASILNGRLVMKMGMRRLVSCSLISMTVISIGFFLYALASGRDTGAVANNGLLHICILVLRHYVRKFECAGHGTPWPYRRGWCSRHRFYFHPDLSTIGLDYRPDV